MYWNLMFDTKPSRAPCPMCGLTIDELRANARVGCRECYTHYAAELDPYIKRLNGIGKHCGKTPVIGAAAERMSRLTKLRVKLEECVESQNFEEACRLRDEINMLEGEGLK